MVQNKKPRVQQQTVKIDPVEELFRDALKKEKSEVLLVLSNKDKQLKLSKIEKEKLEEKVDSLMIQSKNYRNQNKKLERKNGQILKLLLIERNKVKRMEEEISIFKMDMKTVQADIDKEIESLIEDDDTEEPNRDKSSDEQARDDDSDAVEESEDEEEESTEDNERVIVKKEVTSDNEDEAGDISIDSPTPSKRTEEKLLTETEAEEDDHEEEEEDDDDDEEEEEEDSNREGDRDDLEDLLASATEKITNI